MNEIFSIRDVFEDVKSRALIYKHNVCRKITLDCFA